MHTDARLSWSGKGESDGERLQMVFGPFGVHASVTLGPQTYRIEPIGSGLHAVTRVDFSRLPEEDPNSTGVLYPDSVGTVDSSHAFDHRMDLEAASVEYGPLLHGSGAALSLAPSMARLSQGDTTTLVVAHTPAVAAAVVDALSLIQLAVDETNTGYANSGIPLFVQLVHAGQVTYTDTGKTHDQHLGAFMANADGTMDEVHAWRNEYLGDIAVLLVDDDEGCGLVSQSLATHTTAFALVHYECATGVYTLGHELGHLQGARHQRTYDASTSPFAFGHGFIASNHAFRTIMAIGGFAPRVNHWSNDDDTNPVRGSTQHEDNARVLTFTRATMRAFRHNISVSIEGPSSVSSSAFCTWSAVVGGNIPAATHEWGGVASGTASSVTAVVPSSGLLTLLVYDEYGRGNVAELLVTVNNGGPPCGSEP